MDRLPATWVPNRPGPIKVNNVSFSEKERLESSEMYMIIYQERNK
jgi:hypothetical protein